ncbi:hypothetical protein [Segniliparus rugosus]|uniref:Biotin synthase auxiliary protein n=1 Tax=Segniliparus rugosus (strain ATCC BAA-974 / DSM 45345 / CCUG 50838 / CIP 108380 / JCM 13579 / CDC 945) TaxID=679197 RepID=E5XLK7_SEGRC|nr:hypothetical protein [Segniliparus rugosus]EFV14780.1 hypothetical protein HMPREF9336_00376 [Segniliparus rugosus ATCC BAA-974]
MSIGGAATEGEGLGPLAEPRLHCWHTGVLLSEGEAPALSPNARAGGEPPRFCGQCGRRMVVQVHPRGWSATCSRHGSVDSEVWERFVLQQKLRETAQ